jgi:hypothetical protein
MKKKNYGSWDMAGLRSRSYETPKPRVVPKPIGPEASDWVKLRHAHQPCVDCGHDLCSCDRQGFFLELSNTAGHQLKTFNAEAPPLTARFGEGLFLELHNAAPVCEGCGQAACRCAIAEGYARAAMGKSQQEAVNAALNEHIRAHQEAYGRWSDPRLPGVAPVPPSPGPAGPQPDIEKRFGKKWSELIDDEKILCEANSAGFAHNGLEVWWHPELTGFDVVLGAGRVIVSMWQSSMWRQEELQALRDRAPARYVSVSPVAEKWVRQPNGSIIKVGEECVDPMRQPPRTYAENRALGLTEDGLRRASVEGRLATLQSAMDANLLGATELMGAISGVSLKLDLPDDWNGHTD